MGESRASAWPVSSAGHPSSTGVPTHSGGGLALLTVPSFYPTTTWDTITPVLEKRKRLHGETGGLLEDHRQCSDLSEPSSLRQWGQVTVAAEESPEQDWFQDSSQRCLADSCPERWNMPSTH